MAAILRKLIPVGPSNQLTAHADADADADADAYSVEYSFAMEYRGPPVAADIPRVTPVDVDQLPTAAAVSSSFDLILKEHDLPVIQPILKRTTRPTPEISEQGRSPPDFDDPAANSDSTSPSGLTSPGLSSSEVFSCNGDHLEETPPQHAERPSVVTFRVPEQVSSDLDQQPDSDDHCSPSEDGDVQTAHARNGKKGSCYRCLKGNRFTDKEVCIVCTAKYCVKCVLRAMGSMPEGRKCVTCIGRRINERMRCRLGRSRRLLHRVLTDLQVRQIMISELSCKVNQLPSEIVYVNGECLSDQELSLLLNSPNPPRKLKPGSYWYDKVSGFWGKEGYGPCQIISPQLNVGGHMMQNASNGNTDILINGREVTKKELWMLQLAGVECEGKPHLWVSADGSYVEEGQKNIKGCLWGKTRVKLACTVLSLPVPPGSVGSSVDESHETNVEVKTLHRLLLLGYKKSGTSTIYKQAKIVYKVPFSDYERENIKFMIQSNLYGYLATLLEWRERFEEESLLETAARKVADGSDDAIAVDGEMIYSISPKLKKISDWLLQVKAAGNLEVIFPAATREYSVFVEDLVRDAAFQATYNRRHEIEMLPRSATYFLERAAEISRADYEPSDMDILYAEGVTSSNGLSCMEFSFPKSERDNFLDPDYQHDPGLRYQMIRLHPSSLGEKCRWLELFEGVDMVLFCVSLTAYDEYEEDSSGVLVNKMLASKQLLESIITHPTFDQKNFLLILNKYDLLEEKIERVPLSRCEWFRDFQPVMSHNNCSTSSNRGNNTPLAQRAFQYIAMKFKKLFKSVTDRKLYVSLVTGMEPDSVDEAVRYSREIIKWEREEQSFTNPELSSTDIEQSSSS